MVQFLAKGLRGRKHGLRLPEKDFFAYLLLHS